MGFDDLAYTCHNLASPEATEDPVSTIIRIAAFAGSLVVILAISMAGFGVYTVRSPFPAGDT